MKEVLAILRPDAWAATREVVTRSGFTAFTHHRVKGRGATRGFKNIPQRKGAARVSIDYLPKRMVSWIVDDQAETQLVELLILVNGTGSMGDGKIFVLPAEEAIRLRTGQRGTSLLQPNYAAGLTGEGADA